MIRAALEPRSIPSTRAGARFGTAGLVFGFVWLTGLVVLAGWRSLPFAAVAAVLISRLLYPVPIWRGFRMRWVVWLAIMVLPPLLLVGQADRQLLGVPYSSEGLVAAAEIAIRFVVMLVIINSFTATVDITHLAGLMERFGLQGLGFSLGVAMNLLPSFQLCARTAWNSLSMRGGLRRKRWRGLQLLTLTIVTQALRRAEEIALAAEARAFSPERSRPLPLQVGAWDKPLLVVAVLSWVVLLIER